MATKTFPEFLADFEGILKTPISKRALDKIGKFLIKQIQDTTDRGQTFARGKIERLPPLAESTKKQKRRKGLPTRSRLRDTGAMLNSLKATTNFRAQSLEIKASGAKNLDKSKFAHDGSSNRPPRPFIPNALTNKITKQIENIMINDFEKTLAKKL